ncbi:hypothetical protein V8B55DRAFT_1110797 [Mucor lusitanicus]
MILGKNKEKLSSLRRELYLVGRYLRAAKETNASKKPPAPPPAIKTCIKKGDSCFLKAESTTLDESLLNQDCCYGGTGNGVVTFTETSKFDLAQFQHHLKLYNKFQCLETHQMYLKFKLWRLKTLK